MDSAKHRTKELGGSLSLFFDRSSKAAIIPATVKSETFRFYETHINRPSRKFEWLHSNLPQTLLTGASIDYHPYRPK